MHHAGRITWNMCVSNGLACHDHIKNEERTNNNKKTAADFNLLYFKYVIIGYMYGRNVGYV